MGRRILGLFLIACLRALWWALVIVLPLLGVWIASSLATYLNGPRWLAVAAGVALFPGLPLAWDRWSEWRRARRAVGGKAPAKPRVLTVGDRLVLRTLALNLTFLTALCAWYPTQAFAALATRGDWFVEGQSPERVRRVRAFASVAAGGLEFLYDAAHHNQFRAASESEQPDEAPTAGSALPATEQSSIGVGASTQPPQPPPLASGVASASPAASASAGSAPSAMPQPEQAPAPKPAAKLTVSYPFAPELHPVVMSIPRAVEISPESVGKYIAARESNPFLRVKALHDYVTSRVAYDAEAYVAGEYPPQDARHVLLTRKAVCAGYAKLMAALGEATGDQILYIPGDARVGAAGLSGEGHAWNAVKLEGAWYLIDATWDAGSVEGSKFTRRYRTDYLFAPPHVMGMTHFPDAEVWQLRTRPLTRAEFLQQPVLRPWFFSNGLELVAPRSAQVTVQGGHFVAKVNNPRGRFMMADALFEGRDKAQNCQVTVGGSILVDCALPRGKAQVRLYAGPEQYGTYSYAGEFEVFSN